MAAKQPLSFADLPSAWLLHLYQHIIATPGGLASAAALSQTCSSLHALESSSVPYCNIELEQPISSSDSSFWPWLAKRKGSVAGLTLSVDEGNAVTSNKWEEPFKLLATIPDVRLKLVVSEYGYDLQTAAPEAWKVKDFATAATPCKSLSLSVVNYAEWPLNIGFLTGVGHSLVSLSIGRRGMGGHFLTTSTEIFSCLTVLTELKLIDQFLCVEPWEHIATLVNLKDLSLDMTARGDPSPLSALTRLRRLHLESVEIEEALNGSPFRFSSLQPLSGMQQLEELCLSCCCEVTSLQGLSGLSRLRTLSIKHSYRLASLAGVSMGLTSLQLDTVPGVSNVAGVEALGQLQQLDISGCGLTSLQPLAGLSKLHTLRVSDRKVYGEGGAQLVTLEGIEGLSSGLRRLGLRSCRVLSSLVGFEKLSGLQELSVDFCGVTSLQPVAELRAGALTRLSVTHCRKVQEEVLKLPHIQPTTHVEIHASNVRHVVLAGGVIRAMSPL